MICEYRFLKTHSNVTAFAKMTVDSTDAATWETVWSADAQALEREYGAAVQFGIEQAACEHTRRGGKPKRTEILAVIETIVDTTPDAVICAAAIAAWTSWGHDQSEASLVFEGDKWTVSFNKAAND